MSESAVDISAIPEWFVSSLGLTLETSQILCSIILVLVVVCIIAIFTRDKLHLVLFVLLGITAAIALGWLNYFVLVFACLIVALLYASAMRKMLSGG